MPDSEKTNLELHTELCHLRYQQLETRMDKIEKDLLKVGNEIGEVKNATARGFEEIKTLLIGAKDEKFKIMITATATIIVSLLGMLGYVITHIPK